MSLRWNRNQKMLRSIVVGPELFKMGRDQYAINSIVNGMYTVLSFFSTPLYDETGTLFGICGGPVCLNCHANLA